MKIVIDIPEWLYKEICDSGAEKVSPELYWAVYNGTPLENIKNEIKALVTEGGNEYQLGYNFALMKCFQILDNSQKEKKG